MKQWKKWAGIFLSLSLAASCLPAGNAFASNTGADQESAQAAEIRLGGSDNGNVYQGGGVAPDDAQVAARPNFEVYVGTGQGIPQYQAGQKVERLSIRVVNKGNTDLEEVTIVPYLSNAADWPFELEGISHGYNLREIKKGKHVDAVWENLQIRQDVETKNYKLMFGISYIDGSDKYVCDKTVEVKTIAKPDNEPQNPGDSVSNNPADGQTPDVQGSVDMGGVYSSGTSGGGADSGSKSVPRVIVTGFNTNPGAVSAGTDFRLIVHVKNTSATTAVSNMLFDFQAPASGSDAAAEAPAFLPSSGASSVYLDSIPAGETRDVAIDLNARADLIQKPYSINMSIKYEDGSASQFEGSSSLAIPVRQAARFEFSDIELSPTSIEEGQEANLMCSLYNTGRVKLYNVKAKFMGDGISAKDVFVGNLDSGATGTIDAMLTGESATSGTKGKMVVTYEDESGNVSSTEKEFQLDVTPVMEMDPMDMETMGGMPEEEKGFPVIPAAVAAAVVLVVILTIVLLRRRKKKRALAEEEDLADEVDRFTEDE